MGNSINRSANQTSDEHQPNKNNNNNKNSQQRTNSSRNHTNSGHPNRNRSRLRFSTSLLSLSNFTSKHFSRSNRSYSVTNVDQTTNASKGLHQHFGRNLGIVKSRSLHIINRSHSHLLHLTRSLPHISVPRFLTRSTSKLSPDELAAQSKTTWPTPTIILLFSPQFKLITEEYLQQTFEVYGIIARGAFGTVYRVIRKNDRKDCALKVLEKSQIIRDKAVLQLKNEIDIQTVCGHNAFIVKLIAFWQSHRQIYLLSEYIGGGELFDTVRKFSHKLVQLYVAEIAVALDFLHNAGVIYRDLKPENILLDDNFHIKLIDFGLSKFLKIGKRTHTICGTPQYMAPEILIGLRSGRLNVEYDHCVDWFSLGVVACRMLTNQYPEIIFPDEPSNNMRSMSMVGFDVIDDNSAISSINTIPNSQTMSNIGTECLNVSSPFKMEGSTILPAESVTLPIECKDLLNRLLEYKPERRIRSIFGLQRIAFFMNFNFDDVRKMKIRPLDFMDSTEIY